MSRPPFCFQRFFKRTAEDTSVGRCSVFSRRGIRRSRRLLVVLVLVVMLLAVMLLRGRSGIGISSSRSSFGRGCSSGRGRSFCSRSGRRCGCGGIGECRSGRQSQGGNGSDQGEVEKTHLETKLHNRIKMDQHSGFPKWSRLRRYHSHCARSRINFMKFQSLARVTCEYASIQTNSLKPHKKRRVPANREHAFLQRTVLKRTVQLARDLVARLLSCGSRCSLRIRMADGVTSTSSSSSM